MKSNNFLLGILAFFPLFFTSCNDSELAKKLDGSWEGSYTISSADGSKEKVQSIYSFNYDESWNSNVRYINGDFQKPIFGVDESLLSKDSVWLPFSKGSRRLYLDRALMSGRLDFVTPDVMIVYGHSLNKQDHAYFFNLFDAMNLTDPTKKTKVCFCYSRYGDKTSEQVKNEMIKLVLKLFEKYDERNARRTVPLHTLTQLEICGRINIKEIETTFD